MRCIVVLLMLSLNMLQSGAQSPTTQSADSQTQDDHPASHPAMKDSEIREMVIRQRIADLADPSAQIRDRAKIGLMSLPADQLPTLRKICLESVPLNAAQLASLKEVVTQLYLQGELEEDREKGTSGFVGVQLGFGPADRNPGSQYSAGIVVYRCIPGFVGYRMLRDGDIIRGIQEAPTLRMTSRDDFIDTVGALRSGDLIHLRIIRAGKEMLIPISLDPRPAWTNIPRPIVANPDDDPTDRERMERADDYWETQFSPGFDPEITR